MPLLGSQLQANPVAAHLRMSRRESALAISGGHLRCLLNEYSGENHALVTSVFLFARLRVPGLKYLFSGS